MSPDYRQQLAVIRQDPKVSGLALKWAGDPDLADDALQNVYCRLAARSRSDLARIENLYAYFVTTLKHEVYRQYSAGREIPLEAAEFAPAASARPGPSRPVDQAVCNALRNQGWLERFAAHQDCRLARIPTRSADPARYRAVVYSAAGQLLRDTLNNEPSEADSAQTLRAAYPGYFAQPGAEPNTLYQRCRRARQDVKTLLQDIVHRDEI
jgi:DNA-directed RNA polymerase specialized sigma24 family protein